MLDQIWVQQNYLEVLSSIPLSLASRIPFPLRGFGKSRKQAEWMSPFCRGAEEFVHVFVYSLGNGY